MKALSIRQPWAHAILHLGKRVENRDWAGCACRGPVLLHASSKVVLRPTKREPETFGDAVDGILEIVKPAPGAERLQLLRPMAEMRVKLHGAQHGEGVWHPAPSLPLGGIVGRAQIVDVIHRERDVDSLEEIGKPPKDSASSPWYAGGFALVLADVEALPFIPWKGSLGFFDVPEEVVKEAIARPAGLGASTC